MPCRAQTNDQKLVARGSPGLIPVPGALSKCLFRKLKTSHESWHKAQASKTTPREFFRPKFVLV
jgi:hypothetical protein